MQSTAAQRERQLAREGIFAMAAIALAAGLLCFVVCWKYGVFTSSAKSPPAIERLADLAPQFAAESSAHDTAASSSAWQRRLRADRRIDAQSRSRASSPTVVRAADEPAWSPRAEQVEFNTPWNSASGGAWTTVESPTASPSDDSQDFADSAPSSGWEYPTAEELELRPPQSLRDDRDVEPHHIAVADDARHIGNLAPPAPREVSRAGEHRVEFAPRHRLVSPFAEDQRDEDQLDALRDSRGLAAHSDDAPPDSATPARQESVAANVVSTSPGFVVAAPGDSFWTISQRVYGAADFYKALYHHNRARFRRAGNLPVGAKVETPPAADLQRLYPELSPPAA